MKGRDRLRKQEERKRLTWKIPLQRDGPKNETAQHRQIGDKCSNIEHQHQKSNPRQQQQPNEERDRPEKHEGQGHAQKQRRECCRGILGGRQRCPPVMSPRLRQRRRSARRRTWVRGGKRVG